MTNGNRNTPAARGDAPPPAHDIAGLARHVREIDP